MISKHGTGVDNIPLEAAKAAGVTVIPIPGPAAFVAALAFNAVGGESALRLMKLLRESGCHITYGAMGKKPVTIPNGLLIFRDIQVRGLWVSRWIETAPLEEIHAVYKDLAARVAAGKIVQSIDSTFPLEKFQEALARLDAPERSGKVLFVP